MTTITVSPTGFFRAGGTLPPDNPSYVERPADRILLKRMFAGDFCYILTARQMGKSSLVIRTANRLRQEGTQTAIVDLSAVGTELERNQWYQGILEVIARELNLSVNVEQWWSDQGSRGPVQRFSLFLRDIVLESIPDKVVIFIDEIDSTIRLDFTDDFFAAIRALYNQRAMNPAYQRLTFVLLGVATPTDLIKDSSRTPFNIGHAIELHELTRSDGQPLEAGLEERYPGRGGAILERVFHWTNGHPYLTQRLCTEIATVPRKWSDEEVDQLVMGVFFSDTGRSDENFKFVRRYIEERPERTELMQMYREVHQGKPIEEDERSHIQNRLKLIGLVRTEQGKLQVRNQIYHTIFDQTWVRENMPASWPRIIAIVAVLITLVSGGVGGYLWQENQKQVRETQITTLKDSFNNASDADVKLNYLSQLCDVDTTAAQQLFYKQLEENQQALENAGDTDAGNARVVKVVEECLYPPGEAIGLDKQTRQDWDKTLCMIVCDRGISVNTLKDCSCEEVP